MTDPRSLAFYPEYPEEQAKADAWRASLRSQGWTEESPPEVRSITIWHLRKPLPSLPAPLGPSETGIDWSHWNNGGQVIDFAKVRAAGHRFGWGKRTQGIDFVDPRGLENWNAAKAHLDFPSNYHFFEWWRDGAAQSDHFSRTCGEELPRLAEMTDAELRNGEDPATVNKQTATTNLLAHLAKNEERFLRKSIVYSNKRSLEAMFDLTRLGVVFDTHKFLIADWTPPLDLPRGVRWAHFHQKSSTYQIPGLVGDWDLIEYRGDPPANWWEAWPDGVYPAPGRPLAVPNRVIQFVTESGVALLTKEVTWTMWVVEKRGNLLKVFDRTEPLVDWWVRGQDVTPA